MALYEAQYIYNLMTSILNAVSSNNDFIYDLRMTTAHYYYM